ncbi:hypothetical protein HK101_009538 [Irineochytrium annulatum]|nr:hypothetical protein HK101_009538 [Irineochytrium annulatum]
MTAKAHRKAPKTSEMRADSKLDDEDIDRALKESATASEKVPAAPIAQATLVQAAVPTKAPGYAGWTAKALIGIVALLGAYFAWRSRVRPPALKIYLIWTTLPHTFTDRNRKVIDGYLYHHPDAEINIFASHLPLDQFSAYSEAGYKINVIRINDTFLEEFSSPCPGSHWIRDPNTKHGQYYYSHLTDYIRFCALLQWGGVYSDFDALTLARMDSLGTAFIGQDSSGVGKNNKGCDWCLMDGDTYLAPGVMGADKGHHLAEDALKIGFVEDRYDPTIFNAVGPRAVTRAYKRDPKGVETLERHVLYPYNYLTSWQAFMPSADGEVLAESLARRSASLHLYGHKTKDVEVGKGSIVEAVMDRYSVIVDAGWAFVNKDGARFSVRTRHLLRGPRFIGARRFAEEIGNVRVVAMLGVGEVGIIVSADRGRLREVRRWNATEDWRSKIVMEPDTPAALNRRLSRLVYLVGDYADARDTIRVQMFVGNQFNVLSEADGEDGVSLAIPVYNVNALATIMVKTMSRIDKVFQLVRSAAVHYPNISIIVTDDGPDSDKYEKEGPKRGLYYLPLPYDVGLSAGRNRMVSRVKTEYVLTLDDDFILESDSVIEQLIHALEIPDAHGRTFDIAAAKNPADEGRFELDFCGIMTVTPSKALTLGPGDHGTHQGCHHVDFVPNLFVARTALLRDRLKWDELLKLGEHEDFFFRAKSLGVRTLTCPGVAFHHEQSPHWLMRTDYDRMRSRVYDFLRLSLRKHGLLKLVSFGRTMMDLTLPTQIEGLNATEILSSSVTLYWRSAALSFKVLQSSDNGDSFAPVNHGQGENYEPVPIIASDDPEGQTRLKGSNNRITVFGLEPRTRYIFRVHAGNRFDYEEAGRSIQVSTEDHVHERKVNLVRNPSFEDGSVGYTMSRDGLFHVVAPGIRTPHAGQTEVSTMGYLLPDRSIASLSQTLDVTMVQTSLNGLGKDHPRTLTFGMRSQLGKFYDDFPSWRMEARVWYKRGVPAGSTTSNRLLEGVEPRLARRADEEHVMEFDRSNKEWQARVVSVCMANWAEVEEVEIAGVIETFRGHVQWDDWVVVVGRGEEY